MSKNPVLGMPVWAYYINIDDQSNIVAPQLLKGLYGQHYVVDKTELDNFRFIKAEGDLTGTFEDQPGSVQLFYRKANWAEMEDVDMYLHLKDNTVIYDGIEGLKTPSSLPEGMTIRAFKRVATTNGEFWYEISPDQWVLYKDMEITKNPFEHIELSPSGQQLKFDPVGEVPAQIDYIPGKKIQVYEKPYGKITNELEDGTEVTVIATSTGDDGVTWYKIKGDEFINGTYVKLK
jgi:hypothetical protein